MSTNLNAERALIFRIIHRDNLPWILDNGIHCGNSETRDANYTTIGNADLIANRSRRRIHTAPGGTLSDYVPFYFTPYSPMLLNIKTGYNGITRRANEEIVILASSLHQLIKLEIPFVFSDRHAYLNTARFSSELADLQWIDWAILQRRDFRRDANDPEKVERYQAEALVYKCCPVDALVGIACHSERVGETLASALEERDLTLKLVVKPEWYF